MNIFKKTAKELKQENNTDKIGSLLNPYNTHTGPRWSDNNYKSYSKEGYKKSWIVYRCIRERSQAVSSLKLKVYERVKDSDEDKHLNEHPLQKLLQKPNPFYSIQSLLEFWEMSRLLSGKSFWQLARLDASNIPENIYYLRPDRMVIKPDEEKFISGYEYRVGQKKLDLMPEQVMFYRMLDPLDIYDGQSPMEPGARVIDIDNETTDWNKVFFENAARPDGAFSTPDNLNDDSFERMDEQVRNKYQGTKNAHKPLLMEGGVQWQEISKSHKDMDFPKLKTMSRQDICDLFSVPTVLISNRKEDGSTYNNKKEARRYFWEDTILPEGNDLTEEINNDLAPRYGDNIYVKIDKAEIPALRENENDKNKRVNKNVENNVLTLNEARSEIGYDETDWGDVPLALLQAQAKRESIVQTNSKDNSKKKVFDIKSDLKKLEIKAKKHQLLNDYIKSCNPKDEEVNKIANNLFDEEITLEHARKWFAYVKQLNPFENRFNKLVTRLFTEQKEIVLNNLNKANEKSLDIKAINENDIDDILFELQEQQEYFITEAKPVLRDTIQVFGSDALSTVGVNIDFDLENPRVTEFMSEKEIKISQINNTTSEKLRNELVEGLQEGEGIPDLSKRIESVYDEATGYRSELISRTEISSSANRGALEGYIQSGVTNQKQWLAALDERTRLDHRQANGQTVDTDKDFTVGGYSMNAPGDPSAPANQVCNCRCNLLPIVEE
jgi:HK97 family phage portal protein